MPETRRATLNVTSLGELPSRRGQITQTLHAAVVSGELETGVIYSAPALAAQFGVSATPVREAMIDLTREGLVEILRTKGFRVREPTPEQLRDMLELRLLVEVPTVRRIAAAGIASSQRDALHILAQATVETAQNHEVLGHVAADLRFHLGLLALAGNAETVDVIRGLRSRSRLYGLRSAEKQAFLVRSAPEHLQILELVAAGDAEGAETLMHDHIARVGTNWSPVNKPA